MNLYKREIPLSSFSKFRVSIYVVGYKNIGESIVVFFYDDDKIVFSMVIDCYKTLDLNLTEKILDDNHIEHIDMVVWTHPHNDHTPGIDGIVDKYFHSGIVIFSPKFYYGNFMDDLIEGEAKSAQDAFNAIEMKVKKASNVKEIMRTISAYGDMTTYYPMRLVANGVSKDLTLYFLTPIGRRTDEYAIKGKAFKKANELSVSFIMSIDGYNFYFGGDTENKHAEEIDEDMIKSMRWIKVPHHCSLGGQSIVDRLGPQIDFAASTVYASGGLPVESVQDGYINKGARLFMTQLKETPSEDLKDYGVIKFDYKFLQDGIVVDTYTYANAGEYIPH